MSTGTSKLSALFEKHKRAWLFLIAFLLPALLYLIVLWSLDFYPFGNKTVLFMDLKGQYTEFLASLRHVGGSTDNSLLFNWSRSMGGNALGLYAYYSGGIFGFLTCLFPLSKIYLGVMFLEILGIGLCGLTFMVYLEYGISEKKTQPAFLVFSTCYAMMSYFIVYAGCYMWLVGGIFLPLVLLGIERILDGKHGLILYLSLFGAMINNYYTAYMICIFSVLYFALRVISVHEWKKGNVASELKDSGKQLLRYAGVGVLSTLSSLPVLLPVYLDLTSGKLSNAGGDVEGTNFIFSRVFSKLLPGQEDSITNVGQEEGALPSIFAGSVMLILALIFFVQIKRRLKEKIGAAIIIGIMLLSFWNRKIDSIWHGFQPPNWFPYRYAFVFGFFIVFLAFMAYRLWDEDGRSIPKSVPYIALIICCVELVYNARVCVDKNGKDFGYMETNELESFLDETEPLVDVVKENDQGLYRMSQDYQFSLNDSMMLGYNGTMHYSSTYHDGINRLTPQIGLAQGWFWNSWYGANPITDSLFGVKYKLVKHMVPNWYAFIEKSESVNLYTNQNALSIAYAADKKCLNLDNLDSDVFTNQNRVLSALVGAEREYFSGIDFERMDGDGVTTLEFVAPDDKPVYIYAQPQELSGGQIYVNGNYVEDCYMYEHICSTYLGTFSPGERVSVEIRCEWTGLANAWISSLDTALVEQDINELKKSELKIEKHGGSTFEGTVSIPEGKTMVTTIPYDKGYSIKVDGEYIKYDKWLDSLICFDLDAGDHEIVISYSPQGYEIGWFIAIIAVLITVMYFCYDYVKTLIIKKKRGTI